MRTGLAALLAAAVLAGLAGAWPAGKKAAVVLTYDDALASQLDNAVPVLDAAGLKGTFFLIGSGVTPANHARWQAVAAKGHELGNHTLFHPCAKAKYPMPVQYQIESYTVQTMLTEIRTMNVLLTGLDGKAEHAFAVPCGDTLAGGTTDYLEPLRQSGLVRYDRDLVWAEHLGLKRAQLMSVWPPDTATGADMIAAVKEAERTGSLLVFGFHGVGGDHLPVTAAAHAELVAYLKAHQDTIWVAPFSAALDAATGKK